MNYFDEVGKIVEAKLFDSVYKKYRDEMGSFPASIRHHHCASGGYIRHIWEVLKLCDDLVSSLGWKDGMDMPGFMRQALIKLAFIHDLDKLERYEIDPESPTPKQVKYAISLHIPIIMEKESKSSLSCKINNKVNGLDDPIQYYRYKDKLVADESAMVVMICMENGIELTKEDIHCLSYHHGGWSNVGQRGGKMSPMACILHCADLMSAQILGDQR